ncbi:MAG: bifunctional oligoribonuclease/PAP phosphatase NrnA [Ruminococcaceae bacterium]|nr:bifunctional oligoribonuclease/PAP phosphatase NrnA [Oscillospiraceae bacterium]
MKALLDALRQAGNAAILPHKSADGDAIASALALGKLLESFGVAYTIYTEEPVRTDLAFLGGSFSPMPEDVPSVHTCIAIDCGDIFRLGDRAPIFEKAKCRVVIDHHITNDGFGDINLIVPTAAAAAEIVAELYMASGVSLGKAATTLYTGIVTDTGGFRYANTTAKTHKIAAFLLEAGAESGKVCHQVFEQNSLAKIRLEAAVLHAMTLAHEGRTAVGLVSEALLSETGATDEDTSNLSGVLRTIAGVETGVLLREKDGQIKLSMRTNAFLDAAAVCKALGGGGHARAAGASVDGSLSEWKEKIITIIGEAYGRHS